MALVKNWSPVIEKFKKRLSSWKAKNLSFGGRLTLIKSVLGSLPLYYFSLFKAPNRIISILESIRNQFFWNGFGEKKKITWVAWDKVMAPKALGGLGIGSLKSLNLALIAKWWWRFLKEESSTWKEVICCTNYAGADPFNLQVIPKMSGCWSKIMKAKDEFLKLNIPMESMFTAAVGNGYKFSFWKDAWLGNIPLMIKFPRLFALDSCKLCKVSDKYSEQGWSWAWRRNLRDGREVSDFSEMKELLENIKLSDQKDRWIFKPDEDRDFSVKCIRSIIDGKLLIPDRCEFKWNNWVPIKLNIFAWRSCLDRCPSKVNLIKRGVDISSIRCDFCGHMEETIQHIITSCPFAKQVWSGIAKWCRLDFSSCSDCKQVLAFPEQLIIDKRKKKMCSAIMLCGLWFLWKARNELIFRANKISAYSLLDDIQTNSFLWINNRQCSFIIQWINWCCNPLDLALMG